MRRMIVIVASLLAAQSAWAARSVLIQLRVSDLDRSVAFYRDTLGLTLESRDDALGWARIDPGVAGVTIGLGLAEDVEPASGCRSIWEWRTWTPSALGWRRLGCRSSARR